MRIIFFQDETGILKRVYCSRPAGSLLIHWYKDKLPFQSNPSFVLFPQEWLNENPHLKEPDVFSYEQDCWKIDESFNHSTAKETYLFNGRSLFSVNEPYLRQTLRPLLWDVALIQIAPQLQPSNELLKLTPHNRVVGFRRLYAPSVEPAEQPKTWPNLIIFKKNAWKRLCEDGSLPLNFERFPEKIRHLNLKSVCLRIGGRLAVFDKKNALLSVLEEFPKNGIKQPADVSANGKIIAPVFKGKDVKIEPGAALVGPVVLSDGVHIKAHAVIRRSIIGENIIIEKGQLIDNQLYLDQTDLSSQATPEHVTDTDDEVSPREEYRKWPFFSYKRFGKRIFDLLCASVVLILLIPVFPLVMLVIKLTSPGPVFYKARRQGLHGREFSCLKFRTMMIKADSIQERLRVVNQVDGPQFKIDNDPRISGVGKFLRDTCIDELPQFINVLLGQMSVVGPRPSPENENDSCPVWRDARLSVRPGITGLWQICRTRRTASDFQEWVYYDTQYVRNLSFRKDLWICRKTAQKLIRGFLGQFG